MNSGKNSTKKIVATGFVCLILLALLATGASAADQLRNRDYDRDQLQDGSCKASSQVSNCNGDCDHDRLCDQDHLRDGSCQFSLCSNCNGDCDRDRLRDGSCRS